MKTCRSEGFVLTQCILGNFKYGEHKTELFILWLPTTLKEYEIITFIYNRKNMQARFTSLHFSVSEDVIL